MKESPPYPALSPTAYVYPDGSRIILPKLKMFTTKVALEVYGRFQVLL